MSAAPSQQTASWTSNQTALGLAGLLKRARRATVLTHSRPDGDAVGSTLAITRALQTLGIATSLWYVPPVPKWLDTIAGKTPFKIHNAGAGVTLEQAGEPEPDVILIVDTGAWVQVDEIAAWLRPRASKAVVIDHHLSGDMDIAPARLLDPAAAAAAEVIAQVCQRLAGVSDAARLPLAIAEPLYLGLATDTGWFKFSNTRPETLRLAASLREAGVDAPALYQLVEQQDRVSRLRLQARALSSLELFDSDRIAIMSLSQKDFEDCRGDSEDTTGFASDVLSVKTVDVGVLLIEAAGREGRGPLTKISLRSKPGPDAVDVAALTRNLGGGGHARAAGVKLAMHLDEAKRAIVAALLGR